MTEAAERIQALVERHALDTSAAAALGVLLDALAEPAAPTSVHDPTEAVDVHLADSLAALELPAVRAAAVIADLGSGAGLPGLALAAALPQAEVLLVESVRRKSEWTATVAQRAGLANARAVWARAEEWADGIGACDLVCARALASLPVLCEYAAPLLRERGSLVCWKGAVDDEEQADGRAAAAALGLSPPTVVPVQPFPGSLRRAFWVFERTGPVPPGFPRRPGMATKRPLSVTNLPRFAPSL